MSGVIQPDRKKLQIVRSWVSEIESAERSLIDGQTNFTRLHADDAERLALALNEPSRLRRTGRVLESLGEAARAAAMFAMAERLEQPAGPPEWNGEKLNGTLVIVERNEHVGRPIRMARLINAASQRATRCVVLSDPRLVPLFGRSFPRAEIVANGIDDEAIIASADAVAGYCTLGRFLCGDQEVMRVNFRALSPGAIALRQFREKYGSPFLVGISWHSIRETKELPSLAHWAEFLKPTEADFLSLQYGDAASEATSLSRLADRKVIFDQTVDSLIDLDIYAAQVAACHAVVTISNTCAHMAGALGKRTFLVLDDNLRLSWPSQGERSHWYPSMTIVRKKGRAWSAVFEDVRARLEGYRARCVANAGVQA
jgi:hypothetical protein